MYVIYLLKTELNCLLETRIYLKSIYIFLKHKTQAVKIILKRLQNKHLVCNILRQI